MSRTVCQAMAGCAEPEFLHQGGLDLEPAAAERRQRAGGAAEFADQHARPQFAEALPVPLEGGQQVAIL